MASALLCFIQQLKHCMCQIIDDKTFLLMKIIQIACLFCYCYCKLKTFGFLYCRRSVLRYQYGLLLVKIAVCPSQLAD